MSRAKSAKGEEEDAAHQLVAVQEELQRERAERAAQAAALTAMQAQLEALRLQTARASAGMQGQSASSSSANAGAAGPPLVRRSAVQTDRLVYESASRPDVLDNWLFQLEQLFTQLGMAEEDAAGRIREAALSWDLPTDRWWRAHAAQLQARGTPIASWAAFVAALHAHFVPVKDAEAATEELLRVRQRGGETMDAYLLRAAQLLVRARGAVQDETAAQLVVTNADKARFPFAVAAARKAMRASQAPLTFAAVRAALAEAALDEPGARAASGSSSSGNHGSGGAGAHPPSRKHVRVQALRRELDELMEAASDDESDEIAATRLHAAPLGGRSNVAEEQRPRKCAKCGTLGHGVRQCTSKKELRVCFRCDRSGHVVADCPTRAGSGAGAAASAAPKPKNC